MKKAVLSVFLTAVLVWYCDAAFSKGGGKGGGGQRDSVSGNPKKSRSQELEEMAQKLRKAAEERQQEIKKAEEIVRGRGKDHQQQLRACEKQMIQEEAKHRRRVARLKRIRRLADESDNSEIVKRVDELLRKERLRYENQFTKTNQKMEKVRQAIKESSGEKIDK